MILLATGFVTTRYSIVRNFDGCKNLWNVRFTLAWTRAHGWPCLHMSYLSTLHMSGAFFGSFKHGRSSVIFYLGDGERLPCLNTSTKYRDIFYLGCWNMR